MNLHDVKEGDVIIADERHPCLDAGPCVVKSFNGQLYVDCNGGEPGKRYQHFLDDNVDDHTGELEGWHRPQ